LRAQALLFLALKAATQLLLPALDGFDTPDSVNKSRLFFSCEPEADPNESQDAYGILTRSAQFEIET
jgi:hypothetical protein